MINEQPGRGIFLVFNVLIALSVLAIGCSTTIAQPARQEPTRVREIAVPAPETGQWKRFASQERGFEFRYPEACEVVELNESVNVGGRIELSVLESEGMGLNEYVKRFVDKRTRNGDWMIESTNGGAIGGQEAMTVEYRFGGQKRFGTATFTVREDKVYIWSLTAGGFTCDEPDVYGPILASFRFAN